MYVKRTSLSRLLASDRLLIREGAELMRSGDLETVSLVSGLLHEVDARLQREHRMVLGESCNFEVSQAENLVQNDARWRKP